MIQLIDKNIGELGHHITVVTNGAEPRYAYTIGAIQKLGFELLFAGGAYFVYEEVLEIINNVIKYLKESPGHNHFKVNSYGEFTIAKVHPSWSKLMMLGYFDYYKTTDVNAFQLIPGPQHYTFDIPDMSVEWKESTQPVWKWLSKKWDYAFPESSNIITNLDALRGSKVTEVMRTEVNEWEAFAGAGPEIEKEEIRIVSVGTLLGLDSSLEPILDLSVGKGIWRDQTELIWNAWN